ncbi:MAG: MFS transporter [Acidobacteriota bacterium]|nr:MFS transporter [Acidobacteriota bacterium]
MTPKTQAIDIAGILDNGHWSNYQKLLTALAALAVIFDGFDIQVLGLAIPSMIREWHVARADFGAVLAIGLAGMTLGGPLAGYWGDRIGRRTALIWCIVVFALSTVATAFIHGFAGLTILRFITGMGTGGALPSATALVAEFAPLHRRPVAVKLTLVCVPLGGMLAGMLAARILPTLGWRGLYAAGGVMPLVFVLILWLVAPESPRFMARREAMWPQLERFLERLGHTLPRGSAFEDRAERNAPADVSVRALFRNGLARDTTGLWIAFFFCLGSIYLIFGWLPEMLRTLGLDVAAASSGLASYNLGGVFGVLAWAALIPLFGSRRPMLFGALAGAASAALLLAVPAAEGGHALLIGCIGVNGLLANAVQTSLYALASHVYPTSVRATGIAWSASLGRIGGLIASLAGGVLMQGGGKAYWNALAVSMVIAFAGIAWVRGHIPAAKIGRG